MKTDTAIEEYFGQIIKLRRSINQTNELNGYSCFEEFVQKQGMRFDKIGRLPQGECKGQDRMCFQNSARLIMRHPQLTCVEGYATGIIPVMHAWCVTREGRVVETTWKKPGSEYYGIPVLKKYLISSMVAHGVYGLIDLWQQDWPMMRADPVEFKHPHFYPVNNDQ